MIGTALLLPALILLQAQPTFYEAWEDARDAERSGHFDAALASYRRAAQLRPRPAASVIIYGNNLLQHYYPYTRITRCCLELNQWDGAEQALGQAEAQGEPLAERQALSARLREARSRIAAHPAQAPAPVPSPAPVPGHPAPVSGHPEPVPGRPEAAPRVEPTPAAAVAAPPPAAASPVAARPGPVPRSMPAALAPATLAVQPRPAGPGPVRQTPILPWLAAVLAAAGIAWGLGFRKRGRVRLNAREPEWVGPYQVDRLLGRGGFASTYLAHRKHDHRPVALKILHAFRQDDPEYLGRFQQEARLGTLLDHPNIVRLLDPAPQSDPPYLVMEFVEGQRLDLYLKDHGQLAMEQVIDLGQQVASAMAHAHARGVIHRDLKPGNLMIRDGQVKVMDFGISRIVDADTLSTTYAFLGTPLYAAPELQTRTQVEAAADRYSLGIMLFEWIAGRPPFQGETPFAIMDQHRRGELPDLKALRPRTPQALVDLVQALTRKDPGQRPDDPEILTVLAALATP
jgi:hypothetical protein